MIISASRRCDIPAFYSDWFINRIKQGYVCVKNPFNPAQVKTVSLKKTDVDCIVFWTKNALPLINKLNVLDDNGFIYYFLYTITPYAQDIEPNVPYKSDIIQNFKKLSERIGKQRNILRYDPIIINDKYTEKYHIESFEEMLCDLNGYTDKCIISFVDIYKKLPKSTKAVIGGEVDTISMLNIAKQFNKIAKKNNIKLNTCCEETDLSSAGVYNGACIDKELIERLTGNKLLIKKDANQRKNCTCAKSVDIGSYNCCAHGCIYCYANSSIIKVNKNIKSHNVESAFLIDN